MLTRRSTVLAKSKMLVFIPLATVCIFCFSKNSFSQKPNQKGLIAFPFGITDTAQLTHATYDQMLANPSLVCKQANCKVTEFDISFLPKGKDFLGPYHIKGSSLIDGMALKLMKQIKDSGYANTRVFIENIHISCNGQDMLARTIAMKCTP